jgi:GDP-L-fucose synthase
MLGSSLVRMFDSQASCISFGFTRANGDLSHAGSLLPALESFKPDVVIHTAAKVGGIQANLDNQSGFLMENLKIDTNVITDCINFGVQNYIQIGSSCMYPANYRQPLIESDLLQGPLEPTNEGYALAKIVGSKLCDFISQSRGYFYKTLIPSNLYGPGDNFHPSNSHLLASVIRKLDEAKNLGFKKVQVWGTGMARREFTYVEDLAFWIAQSVSRINEFPQYLNLGIGRDYTVREFYETARRVIGIEVELEFDTTKPEGMQRKLMDSSLAREKLGWNPKIDSEEGIRMTYEWFLRNRNES